MNRKLIFALMVGWCVHCHASDFFTIQRVEFRAAMHSVKADRSGEGKRLVGIGLEVPYIEAKVKTAEQTRSQTLTAKAYFFDEKGDLIKAVDRPSVGAHPLGNYSLPVIFSKGVLESIFFQVPAEALKRKWKAIVVFGDQREAKAMVCPSGLLTDYDFPERALVQGHAGSMVRRKPAINPVVEEVVKTGNQAHPQITLFLRPPNGISNGDEIEGVMAMCLLANNVGEIRNRLQGIDPDEETRGMIEFADKHKLAILCWGAQTLWNPGASYDELGRETNRKMDQAFDQMAAAWERGVLDLSKKYGIPNRNFLLTGICASAQWAHRLALRKPDYFLAVSIHIPSSFDAPTSEAARILWLLTGGELDGGYERGIRFYKDCRKMGYPMIFKPIMMLGHAGSPVVNNLATKFFEYALSVKDQRERYDKMRKDALSNLGKPESGPSRAASPWLETFRNPPYYGDYLNQECYPASQVKMIPEGLRVALPTKELADVWNK